jgi:NADH-quinone oxidoreductase subunit E
MLTEETKEKIRQLQALYPEKRSALIPALHLAQAEIGYLPNQIQEDVAQLFGIDANEVHGVVTFYDMFFEEPIGKHVLHVCKNLSCMLRGGDELLQGICKRLNVKPGETSADGEFTVIASECLAACDHAPMLLVDDEVVGPVAEADIDALLARARKMPGHPSPMADLEVEDA